MAGFEPAKPALWMRSIFRFWYMAGKIYEAIQPTYYLKRFPAPLGGVDLSWYMASMPPEGFEPSDPRSLAGSIFRSGTKAYKYS